MGYKVKDHLLPTTLFKVYPAEMLSIKQAAHCSLPYQV